MLKILKFWVNPCTTVEHNKLMPSGDPVTVSQLTEAAEAAPVYKGTDT